MPTRPRTHMQDLKQRGKAPGVQQARREYERHRANDPALAESKRIRNSSRWQRFRDWFKSRHPLCCNPLALHPDEPRPTAQAHHIIPLRKRPDLAFTESNIGPLCTKCHGAIEARERAGEDTAALFKRWQRKQAEAMEDVL
ncbi:MAG: HNH endonuclease signature motif containing protein [Phycisphaeraceae bacterium]